jgi:hypothetical protein
MIFFKIFSDVWLARKNYEKQKFNCRRNSPTSSHRCRIPESMFRWIQAGLLRIRSDPAGSLPFWPDLAGSQPFWPDFRRAWCFSAEPRRPVNQNFSNPCNPWPMCVCVQPNRTVTRKTQNSVLHGVFQRLFWRFQLTDFRWIFCTILDVSYSGKLG